MEAFKEITVIHRIVPSDGIDMCDWGDHDLPTVYAAYEQFLSGYIADQLGLDPANTCVIVEVCNRQVDRLLLDCDPPGELTDSESTDASEILALLEQRGWDAWHSGTAMNQLLTECSTKG